MFTSNDTSAETDATAPPTSFRDDVVRYYASRQYTTAVCAINFPLLAFWATYNEQVGKPRRLQHASKHALLSLALMPLAVPLFDACVSGTSATARELFPAITYSLIAFMGMREINRQSRPIPKVGAAAVSAVFAAGAAANIYPVYETWANERSGDSSNPSNSVDNEASSGRER